jgi:hypothetical protein
MQPFLEAAPPLGRPAIAPRLIARVAIALVGPAMAPVAAPARLAASRPGGEGADAAAAGAALELGP